jgi:manganese/iron transport system permease protein
MIDSFFYPVILAGLICGASMGLLGVYVVGMRMPFIGTCISHAAMAGAVFGAILGINSTLCAIILSVIAAMSLAMIKPDRIRLETNVSLAIVFSLMIGLTFLGIGLLQNSRSDVLGLLWGSLLFVNMKMIATISVSAFFLFCFAIACDKEMRAILFSRSIAAATGVHERLIYIIFLLLCAITLAINLPAVGGLLIFSLITNPAAAAYQLCSGLKAVAIVSVIFGVVSAIGGFFISFYLNLPTGACIVILSTVIFAAASVTKSLFIK